MKCAKAQELFSSYLEKTIQPPMGVAFEQHLAECARCKAEYDRFHATAVVLDELPMVEPPADMHALVMARVEQARHATPARVKWLHVDWQSVFTVRVPAKALAMGAAFLLIFVLMAQLTPLNSITADIFGLQKASKNFPAGTGVAPGPLPWGVGSEKYTDVGAGLFIGAKANSTSSTGTVYSIKLGVRGDASIPVQVYMVPEGSLGSDVDSKDLTRVFDESIASNREVSIPVITQSNSSRKTTIAMVVWKNNGRSFSEYMFMPSALGSIEKSASLSMSDAGVFEILSKLSSDYGTVILAPGSIANKTATVTISASTAADTVAAVARQAGLSSQSLGSSVYVMK